MSRDFSSLGELLAYTQTRRLLDADRYARILLSMGDIFKPDRDGVYDSITGRKILDFGTTNAYWIDKNDRRCFITSIQDYDRAKGDIYDSRDRLIMTQRNHKVIQTEPDRPLVVKAKEAAAAYAGMIMKDHHKYVTFSNDIPDWEDCVFTDIIDDFPKKKAILRELERTIFSDYSEMLNEFEWCDIWLSRNHNTYMVDVKADIRIREWYEENFRRRDIEAERLREEGENHDNIRCT